MVCESHAQFAVVREWLRSEEKLRYVRIVKEVDGPLKASFLALPVKGRG